MSILFSLLMKERKGFQVANGMRVEESMFRLMPETVMCSLRGEHSSICIRKDFRIFRHTLVDLLKSEATLHFIPTSSTKNILCWPPILVLPITQEPLLFRR